MTILIDIRCRIGVREAEVVSSVGEKSMNFEGGEGTRVAWKPLVTVFDCVEITGAAQVTVHIEAAGHFERVHSVW